MAGKISLKTFLVAFSLFWVLSACRGPVDIQVFLEDPEVQEIIEILKETVDIAIDSPSYLVAGNKRINGLKSDKYYLIESEKDEGDTLVGSASNYPKYVYGSGQTDVDLSKITRVSGGSIVNLINNHTYKVKEAEACTGSFSYQVDSTTPVPVNADSSGKITIPASLGTISLVGLTPAYNGYEVMAVAVSPASLPITTFSTTKNIGTGLGDVSSFVLEGSSTTVDYVFAKTSPTIEFKVLRVVIGASVVEIDTANSDPGLSGGNGTISGLVVGKYYKVEEVESDSVVPNSCQFVKTNGTLGDLGTIGKVIGTTITGLTNGKTYRVKSALPYPNGSIKYFKLDDTTPKTASVTSGAVTISESRASCYFDVSTTITATKYYEVMKNKISGAGASWTSERTSAYKKTGTGTTVTTITASDYQKFNTGLDIGIFEFDTAVSGMTSFIPNFLNNMSILNLPDVDSVNDYVFVEYQPAAVDPADVVSADFYVLTVTVNSGAGDGSITITPPVTPTEQKPALTYDSGVTIATGDRITISLADSLAKRTITASASCDWYYNNNTTSISTGTTITVGTSPLNAAGTYTIMAEKTVGVMVYSTWFVLEITP